MRLRPFIASKDFEIIKNWISDERTHALWCANLMAYPIKKENFESVMLETTTRFGDSPYVATTDDGKEMLKLAVKYAFNITKADAVHLNVFPENTRAKKCYESVGFVERQTELNAFRFKDESWGRCNMIIRK